jgi:hypothetical protein
MLIYVTSNIINFESLSNYTKEEKKYMLIYSIDGIFKIENDIIYKLIITNEKSKSIVINNKTLLIDESNISYTIVNSIPIKHACLNIRAEYYKLNKNVFLILEYNQNNQNKLYNVYFINNSASIESIINTIL